MLYIFNLLFSCFYLSFINEKKRFLSFLLKSIPVILIWVLIIGGQDNIGADYLNYYYFFQYPLFDNRFEPLFKYASIFLYNNGSGAQFHFFFYALINILVIFYASYRAGVKHWAIFYFLLVTVSTFFNNQMNGLRQCVAVTFVYWGFVEMYSSKVKGIVLMFIACGFHYSSLLGLLFLYIKEVTEFLTKSPKLLLFITIIVSLLPSTDILNNYIINFLPDFIRDNTDYTKMYLDNEDMNQSTGLIFKISKLFLIPLYWKSLDLLDSNKLSEKEDFLFKFGILSFVLRCVLLVNSLIGRFSFFFWIPSIMPIYYLSVTYWNNKKYTRLFFLLIYSSMIYFIKVAMGMAEYKSSFIYFK